MSNENGLDALIEAITLASGLSPRDDWAGQLMRSLEFTAGMRGTTAETLIRDPESWPFLMPLLLNAVTVRETFFLRHRSHFDYVVDDIRARLNAPTQSSLCVLSTGCATGEEPYSLAIAIHARLGMEALARVRILASDISPEAISKARAGVYSAWAFRDAPSWLSHGYFLRGAGTGAQIVQDVREAVTFEVANVLHQATALPKASVDIIFFRNVAIYLKPLAREEIYREFYRILKPEGVLIVAPVDPRPNATHFADGGHDSTSVYRSRTVIEERPHDYGKLRQTAPVRTTPGDLPAITTGPPPPAIPKTQPPPPAIPKTQPPPRMPPAPDIAPVYGKTEAEALRFADSGDQASVNAMITSLLAQPATAATGYLVRAHLSLDSGQYAAAIEDLRRTLFLRPEHRLARYWYVETLQATSQQALAMAQGRQLEMELALCSGDTILEDGETSAAQLLEAIRFVKEGLT